MSPQQHVPIEDTLLTPREVAAMFGVRTTTIARWAREGKLTPLRTPGGHRRYCSTDVRELLHSVEQAEDEAMVDDAVRLYEQGWSIRQVADKFECTYGVMRRILKNRVTLRTRDGLRPTSRFDSEF